MSSPSEYHKKTILQVLPSLISGGVERGTIEVAKILQEKNYHSLVVSSGGPLVEQLKEFGIPHISLQTTSKNPITIKRNALLLQEVIKQYKIDLVHARSRAPAWSCYLAAKATNTKFITTFHGIYDISWRFKKYYNSVMTKGELVIAVSNFVKQHIIENYDVDESKIRVIHRGVDPYYFAKSNLTQHLIFQFQEKYRVPKNTPVILIASRMTEWKGHLVLVEALHKIKHLNFYCIMAGDLSKRPSFTRKVMKHIAALKLQGKVQIFGNEVNMLGLYGISDIVLSTSILPEAFGRTVIEGQAMEKLVIATNIGGAAETINHQVSGFHVTPNNADELANVIEYCLSICGSELAEQITTNARRSVSDHFSLNSMLDKTISVYNELL